MRCFPYAFTKCVGTVHSDGEKDLGPIVASLSLGSSATMRFRPIPSRWSTEGLPEALVRKSPPIVLTLTLQHGDVLIMEGAEIQEYYQVGKDASAVTSTERDITACRSPVRVSYCGHSTAHRTERLVVTVVVMYVCS